MTDTSSKPQKTKNWTPVLFVLIFMMPVVVAYIMLASGWWAEQGATQKGVLLSPAIAINQIEPSKSVSHQHWHLAFVSDDKLIEKNQQAIDLMIRIHKRIGPDQSRLKMLLLETHNQTHHTDITRYKNEVDVISIKKDILIPHSFYIIDPLGQIILHYPLSQFESDDWLSVGYKIIKDLTKLMKVSRIG
jgi:hypothetical protein